MSWNFKFWKRESVGSVEPSGATEGEASEVRKKSAARETAEAVAIAICLALLIRTFAVQAFKIPSSSMEDTLLIGDHLLVNKLAYGIQLPTPAMVKFFGASVPFFETRLSTIWGSVKKGDIVVFKFPNDRGKDYIKRVVAVGGDRIRIKKDSIYINGKRWRSPYAVFKGSQMNQPISNFGPFLVPEGHVFVMGDNRDRSYDSRYWGTVDTKDIKGKAFIIYWSWDSGSGWVRFSRFLDLIY